ncbi:hypothetical protein F9K97_24845 [Brucella anthropi]|uniref:hypothetical protein n=1 Tax=Brucella anthropi TaxID=529 RepID=UPI00124E5EF5|nr:hypothetical protein [Brucella anthropi]KAB2774634.1 hypothetical protein F9K97_24845 [Brucella anthropi]
MTWLLTLRSRITGWAVAIVVALAILTGAYLKGRADNATSATADRLKVANKARKIEDETSKLGGGDVDAALSRWMRDSR